MKTSISKIKQGDVIRYQVASRISTLHRIENSQYTHGYINNIEYDQFDQIDRVEVVEILPLNSEVKIKDLLKTLEDEGVKFTEIDGRDVGLHSHHIMGQGRHQNKWAALGITYSLTRDQFQDSGKYYRVSEGYDQNPLNSTIKKLLKHAANRKFGEDTITGTGMVGTNADRVWTGANVNHGIDIIDSRDQDNLPQDVLDQIDTSVKKPKKPGQKSRRNVGAVGASHGTKLDLPLVFAVNAFGFSKDLVDRFTKPSKKTNRPIITLRQLRELAQSPEKLEKYLPKTKSHNIKDVLEKACNINNPRDYRLAKLTIEAFDCDPDEMEPITEWDDLLSFIQEASQDPETNKELQDYIEHISKSLDIIGFIKDINTRFSSQPTQQFNARTITTQISDAFKQFMNDMAAGNQERYRHNGEDVKIELIKPDTKLTKVAREAIESITGREVVIREGDTQIMKLTDYHYKKLGV